jgi:DNA polymerase I-like protein with 3'-5' exonuclease and polymerase domains
MRDYARYEVQAASEMDRVMTKVIERLNQIPGVKIAWLHDELVIETPVSARQEVLEILSEMRNEAIRELSPPSALPTRADVDKDPKHEWSWPTSKKPDGIQ